MSASASSAPAAAYHALNRFGMGARLTDTPPANPVAWCTAQITGADTTPTYGLPTTAQAINLIAKVAATTVGSRGRDTTQQAISNLFAQELQAYLTNAVITPIPFRERLVQFWANHFAIMAATFNTKALAGAFVREAIRPHVTGKFVDMFQAVMAHPAMLYSLNAETSYGATSPRAIQAAKAGVYLSLNENLGREAMELYSISVAANYTQADVDALANLLTGYKINVALSGGGFAYDPMSQQPGNQTLLGITFPGTQIGCVSALQMLGTHPATYNHIATKLVTHFTGDNPAASDITAITNVLSSTGGDLGAATTALVQLASAWTPLTKLRTPIDLTIAALRALGTSAAAVPSGIGAVPQAMGQPLWTPPFPNGWSDYATDWVAPESMVLRADWLNAVGTGPVSASPATIGSAVLGPLLSPTTQAAMAQATTPAQQLTVLLAAPEFQRR